VRTSPCLLYSTAHVYFYLGTADNSPKTPKECALVIRALRQQLMEKKGVVGIHIKES